MFSRSRFLIIAFGLIILIGLVIYARTPKGQIAAMDKQLTIGFYNVENLFDTIDDPLKDDQEFLPTAERKWTKERYDDKIIKLGSVISQINGDMPVIMGLSEIENQQVLQDLAHTPSMKPGEYEIIHYESPDERGIDVAMLYRKSKFNPEFSKPIHVELPDSTRPTRDILYVKGKIKDGPELHIFVNHWPSRWGGMEQSEPKRLAAAATLRHAIDSIQGTDNSAYILCMGDFNDYPSNNSIVEVLDADSLNSHSTMVDLMSGLKKTKRGSYNYRGDWDFLDQFMVSRSLIDKKAPDVQSDNTGPYFRPEMVHKNEKYGDIKTNRTYGGIEYYGGFSDHLPVYTVLAY